jgi:Yip1-like protein
MAVGAARTRRSCCTEHDSAIEAGGRLYSRENIAMVNRSDFMPWKKFWLSPHKTTQRVIDSPRGHRFVFLVAILHGFSYAITQSTAKFPSAREEPHHFVLLILFGILISFFALYLSGWCFKTAGNWIGGTGKSPDLRIAVAISWIPLFLSFPLDVAAFAFLVLNGIQGSVSAELFRLYPSLHLWGLLQIPIALCSFIYLIPTISAAHRFSKWRATLAVVGGLFLFLLAISALVLPYFLASQ